MVYEGFLICGFPDLRFGLSIHLLILFFALLADGISPTEREVCN